jgi:hypothetical protein
MRSTLHATALSFCAAVFMGWAASAEAQFYQPTCPTVTNQTVGVAADETTTIELDIENLGGGRVSIFQYPYGGGLEQSRSDPLEFVFIPDDGFSGTTTFMYRVTPESGCRQGAVLGTVTLIGPTTGRQYVKPGVKACGVGTGMALAFTAVVCLAWRGRRRMRR